MLFTVRHVLQNVGERLCRHSRDLTAANDKIKFCVVIDKDRPSTWVPYRESLCRGCRADCCAMLLEVTAEDLVRLDLCTEDEARAPKKLFKRLRKEKVVVSYREASGLFMMQSKANGDCQFLNSQTRLCTVYEKRPGVCRKFPAIGPRPGYCPARAQTALARTVQRISSVCGGGALSGGV